MGLFNLKKSKNKDNDFEASDEWLMGLAGDDHFEGASDGPNASIPDGLASLAPNDDFDAVGPTDDAEYSDLLDSENVDLSSWHFPDLAIHELESDAGQVPAYEPAPDAQPAFDPPIAGDALAFEAPPVAAPATLFHESHTAKASFEPFADDAVEHEGILEPDHRDSGFLAQAPTSEGMGFGSELFASALEGHDTGADDADIVDAELDEPDGDEPRRADEPTIAPPTPVGNAALTASFAPRSREADLLCEILGVEPGSAWSDLKAAHAAAMSEYDPRLESDEDRIALAWAIRREMNSTYATLRLLAAA